MRDDNMQQAIDNQEEQEFFEMMTQSISEELAFRSNEDLLIAQQEIHHD